MRLDKFLCEMELGSRSQVKALIRQGAVTVNGMSVGKADIQIDEFSDSVCCGGRLLIYQKYVYYMLNKPKGVISATEDPAAQTVISLLGGDGRKGIFPVGRLDKDTTGLLVLTDDGELAHRLLSPKNHVDKTYRLKISKPLTEENISRREQGVDIGEKRPTLPAGVALLGERELLLTIREGKYHQVKRMLHAVGSEVLDLERISFGGINLDERLGPGEYRKLTTEEIRRLQNEGI